MHASLLVAATLKPRQQALCVAKDGYSLTYYTTALLFNAKVVNKSKCKSTAAATVFSS